MCSLDGHRDGVYCLAKHPKQLSTLFSGACDGELRVWDLQQNTCIHSVQAHTGLFAIILRYHGLLYKCFHAFYLETIELFAYKYYRIYSNNRLLE